MKICNLHKIKTFTKTDYRPYDGRFCNYLPLILRILHSRFSPLKRPRRVIFPKVHPLAKPVIRILTVIQLHIAVHKFIAKAFIIAMKTEYQIIFYRIH